MLDVALGFFFFWFSNLLCQHFAYVWHSVQYKLQIIELIFSSVSTAKKINKKSLQYEKHNIVWPLFQIIVKAVIKTPTVA